MTYRGFIQEFRGATPGGLAMLWIRRADGSIDEVPCEQAIAVAALLRWFSCDPEQESFSPATCQKEIVYSIDELGILIAFHHMIIGCRNPGRQFRSMESTTTLSTGLFKR